MIDSRTKKPRRVAPMNFSPTVGNAAARSKDASNGPIGKQLPAKALGQKRLSFLQEIVRSGKTGGNRSEEGRWILQSVLLYPIL